VKLLLQHLICHQNLLSANIRLARKSSQGTNKYFLPIADKRKRLYEIDTTMKHFFFVIEDDSKL
jgi:hypothetical protein